MLRKHKRHNSKTIHSSALRIELLESRQLLVGDLVISEFLASNESGLKDADGDYSDWLEVFNSGSATVNLDGWHLTDNADDLTKWQFRGGQLDPGESLVVFASNKNRDIPNTELHTNFKLNREGEYLAIVEPDGETVSFAYDPFPEQFTDVSFGIGQIVGAETLVGADTTVRYLLPDAGAPAHSQWTQTNFADFVWPVGKAALGYDSDTSDGSFLPLIETSLDALKDMGTSVYMRSEFQLPANLPEYNSLQLDVNYDDGFVAYLNGTEVARRNAPDPLAWNSAASEQHGGIADSVAFESFFDGDDRNMFTLVGDADWFGPVLKLTGNTANQTGAAWLSNPLKFGSDYSFSSYMKIDIHSPGGTVTGDGHGGEGVTFVLQSGGNFRLGGPGGKLGLEDAGMQFLAIEVDSNEAGSYDGGQVLPSHIGINTSDSGSIARTAIPRFNGDPALNSPGPNIRPIYLWVEYDGVSNQLDAYFNQTNTKPNVPTISANVDLANLFGGVPELWTGWTAATSDSYNSHDVLQFDLTSGKGQLGLDPISINLADNRDLLQGGKNVLAIHGLNLETGDDDFLLRPELTTTLNTVGNPGYFSNPTPGGPNDEGSEPQAGLVKFSETTKTYTGTVQLVLIPPNENSTIRYTTNGAIPTESSTLYTGPLSISSTTRIRARAFEPGKAPGPVRSEGFLELASNLSRFEDGQPFQSNLPIMVFESFGRDPHGQDVSMVPVTGVFFEPGEDGYASILDEPVLGARGGMRIRGQTSQGFAKKSYALEFWTEDNSDQRTINSSRATDQEVELFGLPPESDWVLHGPYSDKLQLNNYLTFLWSNKIGLYAPRTRLVEVILNRNGGGNLSYSGDYIGTYLLTEKIKRDNNRVDIEALTPQDTAEPEITGGYIWKKDKPGAGDRPFTTSRGQELRMVEPDDSDITTTQKNWLRDHINEFERALYGSKFDDPEEGYAKYIDVDSWVDTWLLVEMTKNIDGFRLSTYYYKDRNGKIQQGPAWDYNLAIGNGNYLTGGYPEGWYSDQISGNAYPYWDRLFRDPNFEQKVIDRWQEIRQDEWSTESLMADIDHAVNLLSDGNPRLDNPLSSEPSNPISRNYDKWRIINQYHWPNCFFGQGNCPRSPLPNGRSPRNYGDYVTIAQDFITRRTAWIDTQFPAGPEITPDSGIVAAGTQVTIDVPNGMQVFYTTNGADPRRPVTVENRTKLIESGDSVQVHIPSSSTLINNCTGLNATNCFVDPNYTLGRHGESWQTGSLGVGYDENPTYGPYIATDVESTMNDIRTSAYIRIPFEVTQEQIDNADSLTLGIRYDDGFVAYLWWDRFDAAVEVARANAPGSASTFPIRALAYNASASDNHNDSAAVDFQEFPLASAKQYLLPGQNYLVLQGLNAGLNSSDFLIDVELSIATTSLDPGSEVKQYTGPITVDRNLQIAARAFNPGRNEWTSPSTGFYYVTRPELAITEINFNPYEPTESEQNVLPGVDKDAFEFVEIKNIGADSMGLAGMRFVDGIEFDFPPISLDAGAYGVIVKDQVAFETRYGDQIRVLGEFDGNLNNTGEKLALVDGADGSIVSLEYRDDALWPSRADGAGATLQLVQDNTSLETYDKHYSWNGSHEFGGSPGAAGAAGPGVVINEVLAHTDPPVTLSDSIELLNSSTQTVDIGGWFLSDSSRNLMKYPIPNGTTLEPGEYKVFDESDFNPNPLNPGPNDFALSGANGDDVWLTNPNDLSNYFVDDVHFSASLNGESFGRVPNETGRLSPQIQNSFGAPSGAPRIGPLLISEFNYNPEQPSIFAKIADPEIKSSDLEFVEVYNPLGTTVDLTDWRIRGGIDYNFDDGQVLGAQQNLVVVSFHPDKPENSNRTRAFRAHYEIGENVVLVGGYADQLNDGGERIVLQRADDPPADDPNVIPHVVEDEVVYDDLSPWATTADAGGDSLHRVSQSAFGSFANSWSAANPSPGTVNLDVGGVRGDFNGDLVVDILDIDLFCPQMRAGNPDLAFDLTGDGSVNETDRDVLIQDILGTNYGDATLDGIFNSKDLIAVFQLGQYEDLVDGNSTWAGGDWSCDGDFTTADLILAFQSGAYENAAVGVPANDVAAALGEVGSIVDAVDAADTIWIDIHHKDRSPQELDLIEVPAAARMVDQVFEDDSEELLELEVVE